MNTAAAAVQSNPFPGLRPFREEEEYLFFGRENQVDAMVDKLAATRFLAVVGTSGSGKSSLVNCGLRPALHGGLMARAGTAWRMAQFRPGSDPLGAMARELAQDGVLFRDYQAGGLTLAEIVDTTLRMSKLGLLDIYEQAQLGQDVNLLVVVDQFEELFRYRQLEAGRQEDVSGINEAATAFVNLLLETKEQTTYPIYVVLTMRSDFLGDCAQFPGLAEAINAGQYLVPRMTRDERRAAISGPVGVGGAEISPVLLTRLVNDVGDNPDQLSILQHALNRTWARWQHEGGADGPLDLAHYEAIGTMAHALDQHAERAYAELGTARQQQICEKLFKALTDKATDPRGVRRPTTLGTLCALANATEAEVMEVIDVFRRPSRSFLMPPAREALETQTVIDISHESLMRVWQRLNTWADEEARSAQTYRRLADTAALHAAGEASLWRDPDLQLVLDWRAQSQPNETWASLYHPGFAAALRFLLQSSEAREAERAEREGQRRREVEAEHEKAETQARHARRMRWAAVVSGALAVVALVVSGLAFKERIKAERQTKIAEQQANIALSRLSRQLAGQANDEIRQGKMQRAFLSGLAAYRATPTTPTQEAIQSLRRALAAQPQLRTFLSLHQGRASSVAFSPDGKTLASASNDNTVILWDVASRNPLGDPLQGHRGWVSSVAFSPDGKTLASASNDNTVILWDVASRNPLGDPLQGHERSVSSVAFSPDGKTLASASNDKTVILWDVASRNPLGDPLQGHRGWVSSVAFSPDGKTLASASNDKTVILWDVASRNPLGDPLQGHRGRVMSVVFSPDGKTLASASNDKTVILWDVSSRNPLGDPLQGHRDRVMSVAFSHDGKMLASASDDKTVILWDVASRNPLGDPLQGHQRWVMSVAFSPDGKTLASASDDKTVILWDVASRNPLGDPLQGHQRWVSSVTFSPDGKTLASASADKTVILWDVASRNPLGEPLQGHRDRVMSVAFSPDGKTLASASADKTVILWDVASRNPLGEPLQGHKSFVSSVAFSPDGKTLASASDDKTVILWDVASRNPLGEPLQGHKSFVSSVAFSPDGKMLASASDDKTVILWDVASRNPLGEPLQGHWDRVMSVAFSPDGKTIASASNDKTVILWDVASRNPLGEPLQGHKRWVMSVAFSPDGKTLASASNDKTVILWDVASRNPLGEPLQGHQDRVMSVAFSPDGKTIASASNDKTVILWDMDVASWLGKVCAIANRNLTHEEWNLYMGADLEYQALCPDLPVPKDKTDEQA